ncbi:MAG: MaoC family dehydratase [Paracholeplasma sp.]|jgi:3-hydroxybutyryl-CoA dehydratase|uniref:(De)hydratase, contains MaoC-like domain n=1 Tax=Acholeplasma brassicae TaxID=61635 RepID=U4KN54_9MOLU|nr:MULTISPECIES: MaoC family dehydratase [Paracholeplasma]MDY3195861.1 MaoC family dehydratase [Paracholeplasma sp.]CCV65675.1 (De)hydratase, contains MaoC-like domain [Paracholeplasma brassicae]HBT59209.1 enoyl-CoA hydratase [Acholeplasmataceae bacterium]
MTIKEIKVGDAAFFEKTITEADVCLFAEVSGDHNPVHLDDTYAAKTMFQKRIAHGGLINSLFSTVLGTQLPGEGTIYLSQESKFIRPVYLNDHIRACVEAEEINEEKNRVRMKTIAYNQHNEAVVVGHAIVMLPK